MRLPRSGADPAPGLPLTRLMVECAARHPLLARGEAAGRADPRAVGALWAPVGRRMADGVAAVAERTAPDLVVHEPFAAVGSEVAARRGAPAVVVEHSLFDAAESWPRCRPPSRPRPRC